MIEALLLNVYMTTVLLIKDILFSLSCNANKAAKPVEIMM